MFLSTQIWIILKCVSVFVMQLSPTNPSCHCPSILEKAAYSWTKNLSIIPGKDPFDAIFRPSSWGTYRPPDRINDCLRPFAATASVFLHSEWSPHPLTLSRDPPPYGFVLDNNRRADTGGVSCIINPGVGSRRQSLPPSRERAARKPPEKHVCTFEEISRLNWETGKYREMGRGGGGNGGTRKMAEKKVKRSSVRKIWFPSGARRWSRIPRLGGSPLFFFSTTLLFPLKEKRFLGACCAWSW